MTSDNVLSIIRELPDKLTGLGPNEKAKLKEQWQIALKTLEASLTGPREFRRKFPEGVLEPKGKRTDTDYWKNWQQTPKKVKVTLA